MEHLPFEHWILDDIPLDQAESRALAAHLESCAHCRQLHTGWQDTRSRMRTAGMAAPAPGFTSRWQNSLAERRALEQKLQIRRTMLYLTLGALAIFTLLMIKTLANTSPIDWAVNLVSLILRAVSGLSSAQTFLSTWFSAVPLTIPLVIWVVLTSAFALLALGWLFTLWRITRQGVTNE
ncbi:MAG TPA: hypothetical protein VHO48_00315 [Anaerolineaceae bacterium]|nr:hypothetical protein [Anaerolineaceae bacterium]